LGLGGSLDVRFGRCEEGGPIVAVEGVDAAHVASSLLTPPRMLELTAPLRVLLATSPEQKGTFNLTSKISRVMLS
jgi:hypothetical protein